MSLYLRTGRLLLLIAAWGGCCVAHALQAAPQPPTQANSPQTTPPPKGKVLFERHEPAVTEGANPATPDADAPPEVNPTGKAGISSSSKRSRTTLHRHDDQPAADAAAPATAPDESPAAPISSVSSSVIDDNPGAAAPIVITAQDRDAASRISAAERRSIAVIATNLDLHLNAHTGEAEARAQLIVRNTGDTPLQHVPLRISGALHWESARIAGSTPLPLQQHHLADDLDHTGVSTELAIALPQPLAPGASVSLDLYYGGTLAASAQRLLALGAPASRAALTDWDTVTDTFTGLRGMGEVLWYPVAGAPALLRDGSAVTDAVEQSRSRDAASSFRMRLTLEYEGSRPDAAFFCGERQPLKPLIAGAQQPSDSGAVVAEWTRSPLGPHTPSIVRGQRCSRRHRHRARHDGRPGRIGGGGRSCHPHSSHACRVAWSGTRAAVAGA